MLYGALLTVVFKDIVFNPTKIIQGKLACLVQILEIFLVKKTVMRTVKKSEMYLLITGERIEIS
jgi:hypothetical protein